MTHDATGRTWAVATPHALATDVARVAFERGGNAVDAALWAAVTLAVVYPHQCGVGGDLFALIYRTDGDTVAVDSSGRAPGAVDVDAVRRSGGGRMPEHGPLSVTVPGAVRGWELVHEQGARLPWADAFGQAIAFAFGGVPVSRSLAGSLAADAERLAADPGMRDVFLPEDKPLVEGDLVRQPALGGTLQALATDGPSAIYGGKVGRDYADGLRSLGSPITPADLEQHIGDLTPPLRGRFGDLDVSVTPPGSQGFVLLQSLALVERLGLDPDPLGPNAGSIARVHTVCGRDRDRHLADPDHMHVHPSTLLDDGHLAALADEVRDVDEDDELGRMFPFPPTGDTIALAAADAEGWGVSLVQSLFDGFGAGLLEPRTGIVPHDRGAGFTLEAGHANVLSGGKRPAHTLMPVLVHRRGRLLGVAGTRGGYGQPQINYQTFVRAFVQGRTSADAVAAPRWLVSGMDQEDPDRAPYALAEADVPSSVIEQLEECGLVVETVGELAGDLGHAHVIAIEEDALSAGSDPRSDGAAAAA